MVVLPVRVSRFRRCHGSFIAGPALAVWHDVLRDGHLGKDSPAFGHDRLDCAERTGPWGPQNSGART